MQVVKRAGHADVRNRLVHDLLQLHRAHATVGHRGGGQDTELGEPAGGQYRGQLHHQPGRQVERVVQPCGIGVHLVEREVVEVLDQLGIGLRQRGDAVAEQLVVIAPSRVALIGIDYTPAVLCAAEYCSPVTGSSQVVALPSPEASRIA